MNKIFLLLHVLNLRWLMKTSKPVELNTNVKLLVDTTTKSFQINSINSFFFFSYHVLVCSLGFIFHRGQTISFLLFFFMYVISKGLKLSHSTKYCCKYTKLLKTVCT